MTAPASGFSGTTAGRVLDEENQNPPDPPPQIQRKESSPIVNLAPALTLANRRWRALVDGDTGNTYYVDEATGVSQWEKPPPEEMTQPADTIVEHPTTPSTEHRTEVDDALAGVVPALVRAKRKWLALVDDSTGRTYYVNKPTGETQWEKPPEVDSELSEEGENMGDDRQEGASGVTNERRASNGGLGEDESHPPAALEVDDSTARGDDTPMKPSFVVDKTPVAPSGGAAEVATDKEIQGGGEGDPFLQRADSNSTLSTYGGELESLAKYVTGHSTTLDRGAVVDLEVSKSGGGAEGGGKDGGGSTSDTGEDTAQSTEDPSDDNNGSASESKVESDEYHAPTNSTSPTHDSVAERGAPSPSVDGGTPSQDDSSPREHRQPVQSGEPTADGDSSKCTRGVSLPQTLDASDDYSSQLEKAPPNDGQDGRDKREATLTGHQSIEECDARAIADRRSPTVPAAPGSTEVGARTASTVEGAKEESPAQQKQDASSAPSSTNDLREADDSGFEEAPKEPPGAGEVLSEDVQAEAMPTVRDDGHAQPPTAILSREGNERNAMEPAEQNGGDRLLQPTEITVADTTSLARSPSPFDTAAVAMVALERLKAGMKLRQQREASVKLQAQARGWAARRSCARLAERRDTRRREEREAKQRAAIAIQAMVRGRAGRRKARQARHLRTELGIQQAQLEASDSSPSPIDRGESISQKEAERGGNEVDVGSTDSRLGSDQSNQSDETLPLGIGASRETSDSLADGCTFGQQQQACVTQAHQGGSAREDGSHYDSTEPAATKWSEGEPPSCEAETDNPRHHQQFFDREQDVLYLQPGDYDGMERRFEPGPLGTIDEEGHQRSEHLWGGSGAEEPERSAEASSEDDERPLDGTRATAGFSSGPSELARNIDTAPNSPGSSETSDDDFNEESTSVSLDSGTGSNERKYVSSSRTSLTSKTATTTAGSASSAETTAPGSQGDTKPLSDDGDFYPAHHQPSTKSYEDQWVDQQCQHPPERTAGDHKTSAADEYHDGNPAPADNDSTGQADEDFGGSEESAEGRNARDGVYLDTTAPMEKLEDLRSLVAAQAQATARAAMTTVGTDVSKREAARIR